ncbi:vitellogenin-like [Narcine bancroftii]|uniref:vitellogenin-like n=1 Tax=Narcine bancroftii TaxID=1343680 RepID=UPI0038322ABD
MRAFIFLLTLTLAGGEHQSRYDPTFSENKVHIYRYEGVILSGLPERGLNQAGLRISSRVKISGIGQNHYLLQIENPRIQELNGIWPKDQFISARKLTERLAPQLTKPVKFGYNNGRVGTIYAPASLPENLLNIHRGIINSFQITIKKSQNFYDLQEAGIEGICHTRYTVQEDRRKERMVIIKSKDLNNCQEKVIEHTGMAYMQTCPTCQQRGKNIRASSSSTLVLKPTRSGAIIREVRVRQNHQFTPFQELDGNLLLETRQSLILEKVTSTVARPTPEFTNRGSLQYHSDISILQQPFMLVREQNLIPKIKDTLSHLAQHNILELHADAPSRFLELVQLMRYASYSSLTEIWRFVRNRTDLRQWFLEAIPAVGTIDALKCLKTRIQDSEINYWETLQSLVLTMHQIKTDRQVISLAYDTIKLSVIKENPLLHKITLLAYGSMVNRFCSGKMICPNDILKPLHNLLTETSTQHNEENIALSLKAIGNAGQPASIKSITKLLPGFGSSSTGQPLKIRVDAIMALSNIAKKDPRTVQRITVQIFLNRKNRPEERMIACAVLFLTKPPLTLVSMVANSLVTETSLQVASFTYSHMRALSRSSLPGIYTLATSCNLALNILSPKLLRLGHRFSKVYRMDTFMYQLMAGVSVKALLIKSSSTYVPTAVMTKIKGHGLGGESDLIEVGLRAEGLQSVLMMPRAPSIRISENKAIRRILSKFVNWKDLPEEKPLASAYIKVFGQELSFVHLRKDTINQLAQTLDGTLSTHWKSYLQKLNNGVTFQPTKAILASEMRRLVPTAIGLPMELGLISTGLAVSKGTVEVRSEHPISKIIQLLTTRHQVKARLNPSVSIHARAYLGINMPYIQSAVTIRANVRTTMPMELTAKINVKDASFRIESTPAERERKILSISSQVYTLSRNIENLSGAKMIPILPRTVKAEISKQAFKSSSKSEQTPEDRVVAQVSPETLSDQIPCSAEDQRSWSYNQLKYHYCIRTPKVGVQACMDVQVQNALSIRHVPLYTVIGKNELNITVSPISSEADIEKIVLEVQGGAKSLSKMMRLEDKEMAIEKTLDSQMDQDKLRTILMKTPSEAKRYNSTWGRYGQLSSSSSATLSGSSQISPSSSLSDQRRRAGEQGWSREWSTSQFTGSSHSSSSSSSRLRSGRRTTSGRIQTHHSGSSPHSMRRSGHSKSITQKLMELDFRSIEASQYTITKHRRSMSTSKHTSGSAFITKIERGSGSRGRHTSRGSSILRSSNQRYLIGTAGSPSLVVLLRARRTDGVQRGYQLSAYTKISSRLPRMHLRLVELDQKSNWKICADALLPSSQKVLALARWGENCERYKVSAKLSTGQLASHPAMKLKMRWSKINENLKYGAKVVGDYLPGLAYSLGLSQSYKRNPSHQITTLVALTSPQTIDAIVKLPKMSVYYQGLQIPSTIPLHSLSKHVQERGYSSIREIPELLLKMNERECVVQNNIIQTFDGNKLNHQISNDCYYILTQDCTDKPKFMLLMKRAESDKSKKSIKLIMSLRNTTIEAIPSQDQIKMLVNGVERSPDQPIPNLQDIIIVQRNGTGVVIQAPSISIESLYFDGNQVQITLDHMMGKTCGLCGLNNGEQKLIMPNHEEAKDQEHLYESWLCSGTSCKDDCRVKQEFVELGQVVEFDGEESRCYSVEPVQRCLAQCTPLETRSRSVNFHCVPSTFTVTDTSLFNRKSVDISRSVDAHSDCLCRCTE